MTCARVAKVRAIAVAKEQRASVQKACAQASLKSPATMAAMAKPIPVPGRSSGSLTRNQSDTSLPSPIGDEAAVSAQAPRSLHKTQCPSTRLHSCDLWPDAAWPANLDDNCSGNQVVDGLAISSKESPERIDDSGHVCEQPQKCSEIRTQKRSAETDRAQRPLVTNRNSNGHLTHRLPVISRMQDGVVRRKQRQRRHHDDRTDDQALGIRSVTCRDLDDDA